MINKNVTGTLAVLGLAISLMTLTSPITIKPTDTTEVKRNDDYIKEQDSGSSQLEFINLLAYKIAAIGVDIT